MHSPSADKKYFAVLSALFLAACTAAVFFYQLSWLLLPSLFVCILLLIKKVDYLFYLLVASIPWSIEYAVTDSLATDLPDEPLMLLCSFITLVLLIGRYKSFQVKQWNTTLLLLLGVQLIWTAVSVLFSVNLWFSIKYFLAKGWYLLPFVALPILLFRDRKIQTRSAVILAISMMVCVLVIMIRHSINDFRFDTINLSLKPFFRNHVNYSALLMCIVPLLFSFYHSAKSKLWKKAILMSIVVALAALYFSYARGAWLAVIIGAIALLLVKKKLLVIAYVISISVVVGSVFWLKEDDRYVDYAHDYNSTIFHADFGDHLAATYGLKDLSTAERFYRWIAGVRMIKDNWKTGSGPATFYPIYKRHTVPAFKTWVSKNDERSTVHNYYLLTLIEQGILGLLLLLLLIGYMFYTAQKIYFYSADPFWKSTAAVVAVILSMICTVNSLSDLVETDKVGSIYYLCLGTLIVGEIKLRKSLKSSANV